MVYDHSQVLTVSVYGLIVQGTVGIDFLCSLVMHRSSVSSAKGDKTGNEAPFLYHLIIKRLLWTLLKILSGQSTQLGTFLR